MMPHDPTPTDTEHLRAFVRGDTAGLAALASRHEAALFGLASGLLGGRDDLARDAVQDAWVRVIRSAKHFEGRSSVKTWLYRIVINRCRDLHGRLQPRDAAPALNGTAHDTPPLAAERVESGGRVRAAVGTLSGDARLLLLLCYQEGLSHTEAAEVLGIPVGTLKSRLHAALDALRERLGQEAAS